MSSKESLRSGGLQGPTLLGVWWSLGCVQKEWLTTEMFRLDHAFGLGKPCLKFTGRNEAEFAMWCLKTLKLAKCLSNASHLPWMGRAVPCPTVNPAEMKKVGPLHLSFVVSPKT